MIISHYSMLGTLSTRPVVKGTKKVNLKETTNHFNAQSRKTDLKKSDLKVLCK